MTYRLTQGVVKRIIPAVASTNAVIAAACCTEVFKLATSACTPMNNYCVFNDSDGIYTYTYEQEKKVRMRVNHTFLVNFSLSNVNTKQRLLCRGIVAVYHFSHHTGSVLQWHILT